jgi:DNA primase
MLDKCEEGLDLSTEIGRVELLKRTAKVLAGIESALEREVYISRTSKKCDIPVQVLKTHIDSLLQKNSYSAKKKEWSNIKAKTTYIRDDINPDAVSNKKEARAEETIISYLLMRPQEFEDVEKLAPPECFVTAFNKKVYTALLERLKNSDKFSVSLLSDEFSTDEMGRISGIAARKRDITITRDVVADCAKVLKNNRPASNGDLSNDELLELFRSKNK